MTNISYSHPKFDFEDISNQAFIVARNHQFNSPLNLLLFIIDDRSVVLTRVDSLLQEIKLETTYI